MKKVDLSKQEIRWLENLIMNQIITIGDLIEELKKDEKRLLDDYDGLKILFNKITDNKMRW